MLPSDPMLPGLTRAWDSASMRESFRGLPRTDVGAKVDVEECVLHRFRYRQASRAIMLYELTMTATTRKLWVTGSIYRGDKAERLYGQLRSIWPKYLNLDTTLPLEPVSYVRDLGMLVQSYPFDRHIPMLLRLMDTRCPEIEAVLLEQSGLGGPSIENRSIEPVRYRPGVGATLRVGLQTREAASGERQTRCFYVKAYRTDEGESAHRQLSRLDQFMRARCDNLRVPRPVAYLKDFRASVIEAAPGICLERVLLSQDDIASAARKVSRALATLHLSDAATPRQRVRRDVLARAARAAKFLKWGCPKLSTTVDKVLSEIETGLVEVNPRPTHLDLKADHVFLADETVTFIDLDSYAGADPVLDPAMLIARLHGMRRLLPVSGARIQNFADTFAEEYFAQVPKAWRDRFGVAYACAALKVALYFLQHVEPDWPDKVAGTLASARAALDGRRP